MKKIILIFLMIWKVVFAQPNVNYNDVVVIVNDNNFQSVNIANYFAQKRNIPNQNLIHVSCTSIEEIDSSEFMQIKGQIETALLAHPNLNDINYLVTTKGLPLKVRSGDVSTLVGMARSGSFDSELTLMLSNFSNFICSGNNVMNPYFHNQFQGHFSRTQQGVFLVTRLDAYTIQDVYNIIDRSGPNTAVNKNASQIILTYANAGSQVEKNLFYNRLKPSNDSLIGTGWNTLLDTSNTLLQGEDNVFGYNIVYYNAITNKPNFNWVAGSVSEITKGYSASTFNQAFAPTDAFNVADLVAEGACGAHGYVYQVFLSFCLLPEILFDRYTDTAQHFNLAESYYQSIYYLSTHDVVIGDPKTTITIDNTVGIENKTTHNDCIIYPNPSANNVNLNTTKTISQVSIYDVKGHCCNTIINNQATQQMQLDISHLSKGLYCVVIQFKDNTSHNERFVKY